MNNIINKFKLNKYDITYYDCIDSTNSYLMREYKNFDEYTVIVSDSQTAGKGRLGRRWKDDGKNIAISILLKPHYINGNMQDVSKLTLICGAAASKSISELITTTIKWPNDVLINNKKICGILCESIISEKLEALVLGIGINVNQTEFDEDIKNKATSIKKELGKDINKIDVIKSFLISFDFFYQDFLNKGNKYLEYLKDHFYLKNKTGYINNQEVKILGVDDDGNLIIDNNGEIKKVFSGEVTLEKFYS